MTEENKGPIKLALCVPARGPIDSGFLSNYMKVFVEFMKLPGVVPIPFFSDAMPVDEARNQITQQAMIARCDYYLWLDADVFPNPINMVRMFDYLLKNEDIQAVSGIYFLRAAPYEPVIRKLNDLDIMAPIGNFDTDKPFPIDGMGFGCVIHRRKVMDEVFVETKGKPFQFTPNAGEDLFWCRKARDKGHKIMCYPQNLCGHYGSYVGEWHFMHYQQDRAKEGRELAKYTGQGLGQVYANMIDGIFQSVREWKKVTPKTNEEITKFHKDSNYLYMLTKSWADSKMQYQILGQVGPSHKKILDFGCGIGDYGLSSIENSPTRRCDFYDINDKNLSYLEWRISQRIDAKTLTDRQARVLRKLENLDSDYDVIYAVDVLEFIPDAEKVLELLRSKLKKNGIMFITMSPKESPVTLPMPMRVSAGLRPMDHGFMPAGPYAWIRNDSEHAQKLSEDEKNILRQMGKV